MEVVRIFVLCSALAAVLSGCASHSFQDGIDAYNEGKYDTAAYHWNTAAEKGDMYAQYNLGLIWEFGLGQTPADKMEASRWYLMAAKQGYVDAMVRHALIERDLNNTEVALYWLTLAARWNNQEAMTILGEMGQPVPEPDLAAQQAKDKNIVQQQSRIAVPKAMQPDVTSRVVGFLNKMVYLHRDGSVSMSDAPILKPLPTLKRSYLDVDTTITSKDYPVQIDESEEVSMYESLGIKGRDYFKELLSRIRQMKPFGKESGEEIIAPEETPEVVKEPGKIEEPLPQKMDSEEVSEQEPVKSGFGASFQNLFNRIKKANPFKVHQ